MTTSRMPVRQASVRAHNLALVLQTVANSADRPSRAALAAATGLTRATVSALVDDLITGGLLTEHDPPPRAGAGRPAAGLALAANGPAGLGLEINVDYLAACVVDLTGAVRHRFVAHADQRPLAPAAALAALGGAWLMVRRGEAFKAFLCSSALIGLLLISGGVGLYPNLVVSTLDPAYSLTIYNAAAAQNTLEVALIIAVIGIPFVLLYTTGVYYIFRGKTVVEKEGY